MPPDEPPPQPVTLQIPKEEIVLASLQKIIETQAATRLETAESFHRVETNLSLVSSDVGVLKSRVEILETERNKISGGVRNLSQSDAGQNQEIANLSEKVDALALTLKQQSDFMGMGKRGLEWAVSEKGRTAIAQLIIAIVAAYEAARHTGVIK